MPCVRLQAPTFPLWDLLYANSTVLDYYLLISGARGTRLVTFQSNGARSLAQSARAIGR